jgi:hypothetical protein
MGRAARRHSSWRFVRDHKPGPVVVNYPEGPSILMKPRLQDSDDVHRPVLAELAFLDTRWYRPGFEWPATRLATSRLGGPQRQSDGELDLRKLGIELADLKALPRSAN